MVVPEGQMRPARPHDQADRAAGALRLGAPRTTIDFGGHTRGPGASDGSAPRVAGIGLQDFSKISPAERQELFVADAGRG